MTLLIKSHDLFERRWLFIVTLYLIVELARPQSIFPIGFLRPGVITIVLLFFFTVFSGKATACINKQILLIFFFVSLLIAYIPLATNNFKAYQVSLGMCLMIPLILSVSILINSRKRIIYLFWTFGLIVTFVSCYGLLHNGRGPGGIVSDENDLCLFLVTFLPFIFFLLTQQRQKYKKP